MLIIVYSSLFRLIQVYSIQIYPLTVPWLQNAVWIAHALWFWKVLLSVSERNLKITTFSSNMLSVFQKRSAPTQKIKNSRFQSDMFIKFYQHNYSVFVTFPWHSLCSLRFQFPRFLQCNTAISATRFLARHLPSSAAVTAKPITTST